MCEASKTVLAAHGAELTPACVAAGLGKRPLEAWQVRRLMADAAWICKDCPAACGMQAEQGQHFRVVRAG